MRRLILKVAVLLFLLAPGLGHGQSVSAADARAVRQVIEAQLDAFKRDDAPRAFSYAAPGIREAFGTPEKFMCADKAETRFRARCSREELDCHQAPLVEAAERDCEFTAEFTA